MATTLLRDYLNLIDQLLEDGRYHEATQHCRHILQQYPRHIPTYRALANALLEQRLYADALDIFHRVLSADPNDFIAHVGLAMVHREEKRPGQAVWHMERAWELEPYNSVIQQELQSLYRQTQNGHAAAVLTPNRCALAHLYYRCGMYSLAVAELRDLQAENEGRMDLDVLLAKALWRDNRRVEAVKVCLRVLEELPACIPVNAILGEIWLLTGRIDEAQTYLQRLQELTLISKQDFDPETAVGHAFLPAGAPALPDDIRVEALDVSESGLADAADVGSDWEEGAETAAIDGIYGWLQDLEIPAQSGSAPEDKTAPASLFESKRSDWFQDDLTDEAPESEENWLAELDGSPPGIQKDTAARPAASEKADFADFTAEFDKLPPSTGEIPSWLSVSTGDTGPLLLDSDEAADWLGQDEQADLAKARKGGTDWFSDPTQERLNVQTDWFVAGPPEPAESPGQTGEPDWLDEVGAELEPVYLEMPDLDEWLVESEPGDLAAEETPPETAVSAAEQESEQGIPDWLLTGSLDAAPPDVSTPPLPDEPDEEGVPQWLMTAPLDEIPADLLDEAAVQAEVASDYPAVETDDAFDWLMGEEEAEEEEREGETAVAAQTDPGMEPVLDLGDLSRSPDLVTGTFSTEPTELPDWLSSSDLDTPDLQVEADDEDDALIDDLFGSLAGAVIDDTLIVAEADSDLFADLKTATPDLTEPPELMVDPLATASDENEKIDSSELPPWLFGASLGDSDELTSSPSGNVNLSQLAERPELATSGLEEGQEFPDWLAPIETDSQEWAEEDFLKMPEPGENITLAATLQDDEEDDGPVETFAAAGISADVPLKQRGSGLLNWLKDEFTDTSEMEAVDMADKDEVVQPVPEMPEDESAPEESAGLTDWLQDLANAPGPDQGPTTAELEPAELPDWMRDLSQTGPLAAEEPPEMLLSDFLDQEEGEEKGGSGFTEMLDWLQEESEELDDLDEPDADVDVFDFDFTDEDEGPDTSSFWLDALAAQEERPAAAVIEPASFAEPAVEADEFAAEGDDWLAELQPDAEPDEEAEAFVEAAAAEGDWLGEIQLDEAVEDEPEAITEATAAVSDWLAELKTDAVLDEDVAAMAEDAAEVSDWLAELKTDAALDEEAEVTEEAAAEVTDWLAELKTDAALDEEEEAVAEAAAEVTDWLAELKTDAAFAEEAEVVAEAEFEADFEVEFAAEEGLGDLAGEELTPEDLDAEDALFAGLDAASVWEDAELEADDLAAEFADYPPDVVETAVSGAAMGEEAEEQEEEQDEELLSWLGDLAVETPKTTGAVQEDVTEIVFPDDAMFPRDIGMPTDVPEELDDTMAWLAELAAEQGVSLDDIDLVPDEEPALEPDDVQLPPAELEPLDELDEIPSAEIDSAMDWLEQLAAEQGAPIEPLPTVADRVLADDLIAEELPADGAEEIETAVAAETDLVFPEDAMFPSDVGVPTDVPEEVDDAMAWLQDLMQEQGITLDEAETAETATPELEEAPSLEPVMGEIPEPALEPEDELALALARLAEEAWEDAAAVDVDTDIAVTDPAATDLFAALDWVEKQLRITPPPMPDLGIDVDEIPEDPEQALAWLAGMADEEEAAAPAPEPAVAVDSASGPVTTAPTDEEMVASIPDDPDATVAWLEQLAGEQETAAPPAAAQEHPEAGLDALVAAQEIDSEETAVAVEDSAEGQPQFDINAELAESWPEWLDADAEGDTVPGQTDWLKSFTETDVSSWLAAEDDVTASGIFESVKLPDFDSLRGLPADADDLPQVDSDALAEMPEISFAPAQGAIDQERLQQAREALGQTDLEAAVQTYQQLVEDGQGLGIVIADLETAVQNNPKHAAMRRLLGDAYMRNGQLQKALDIYRQALDLM